MSGNVNLSVAYILYFRWYTTKNSKFTVFDVRTKIYIANRLIKKMSKLFFKKICIENEEIQLILLPLRRKAIVLFRANNNIRLIHSIACIMLLYCFV